MAILTEHFLKAMSFFDREFGAKVIHAYHERWYTGDCDGSFEPYDWFGMATEAVDLARYKACRDVFEDYARAYAVNVLHYMEGQPLKAMADDWMRCVWHGKYGILNRLQTAIAEGIVCEDLLQTIVATQLAGDGHDARIDRAIEAVRA